MSIIGDILEEHYEKELAQAREKAIDEFAEKLCEALQDQVSEIQMEDGILYDILTLDGVVDVVLDVAERMKGEDHG